ncbi:MAG: PadR family transcriptional regulator [Chloroflexota bacterium]
MVNNEKHTSQLLKGVLDMCLLALLAEEPCYGYEIVQKLTERGLSLVSEGSIYPILSRLQQHSYIESYRVPSPEGPSRKYYRLLPAGYKQLAKWAGEWEQFTASVNIILRRGESHESDEADGDRR